ncbi:DUF2946 domain-containing protein [Pseudomonas sp. SH1-B]
MLTARRRTFAARLGLLAFVLIIFAPLASQLRAAPADWRWLNELSCHDGATLSTVALKDSKPVSQVDPCGYCSLFSHCPVLAESYCALPGRLSLAQSSSLQWPPPLLASVHYPHALSRAPPLLT